MATIHRKTSDKIVPIGFVDVAAAESRTVTCPQAAVKLLWLCRHAWHNMPVMRYFKRNTLYCFSPPIMIATCIIETTLLIYTFIRYRLSPLQRIVGATLALLALFQLCEFNVCATGGPSAAIWSRVGFAAITMLPPLGTHLIGMISKRVPRPVIWLAYCSGLAFALMFGLGKGIFRSHVCAGNYAIFQLAPHVGGIYFAYYYGWLIIGIALSLYLSAKATLRIREALIFQTVGYLILLIPVGITNELNPQTIAGIPSIMCGFAVVYAIMLVFGIVPRVLTPRRHA